MHNYDKYIDVLSAIYLSKLKCLYSIKLLNINNKQQINDNGIQYCDRHTIVERDCAILCVVL